MMENKEDKNTQTAKTNLPQSSYYFHNCKDNKQTSNNSIQIMMENFF